MKQSIEQRDYYAPVYQGLIAPEHYRAMGDSIWLYIHFLQKETRDGRIRHGTTFTDTELAGTFGVGERKIRTWRRRLLARPYITAKRKPKGYVYGIVRSKKFRRSDLPKNTDHSVDSDPPNRVKSPEVICPIVSGDLPNRVTDSSEPPDGSAVQGSGIKGIKGTSKREENTPPDSSGKTEEKAIHFIWDRLRERVHLGPDYNLTAKREEMISLRLKEMTSAGISLREAASKMLRAISAFAADDYHMGRKKGYEGKCRKGIENVFGTRECFENWLIEPDQDD